MRPILSSSPSLHLAGALLVLTASFTNACGPTSNGAPLSSASAAAPTAAPSESAAVVVAQGACSAKRPHRFERDNESVESASVELIKNAGPPAGAFALVADADERALHVIDAATLEQLSVTPLPGTPVHVLALEDGRVAVTLRDTAHVAILEAPLDLAQPFEQLCQLDVAVEPWGLAEGGGNLYVTSAFGAQLAVFRSSDMSPLRSMPLAREPRAIAIDPSGKTAFVAHATGGVVSAIDLSDPSKAPTLIDVRAGRRSTEDGGDDASVRESSQGYSLAMIISQKPKSGETFRLLVPHATVDPGIVGEGIHGGGYGPSFAVRAMAPIVAVIDPATRHSLTTSAALSRTGNENCVLPRSALVHDDRLYVACLDGAVVELDPWLSDPMMGETRRFDVPLGPSGLAASRGDNGKLFVWSELERALSSVEIADKKTKDIRIVSMAPWQRSDTKRDPVLERGKRLFHTASDVRLSQGRACESCHPEGRDDGLVWSSPDGARQTPMLAGRLKDTAPYGWFGENLTLRDHLKKTFERLGGTGLDGPNDRADLDALIAYVSSLAPPPLAPARDTDLARRGKDVFIAAGCGGCHKDGGTDAKTHDVGSGVKGERKVVFDTPTLRGVRGSAPYFHDARYAKLEDVVSDRDTRMFDSKAISEPDRVALLAYLETL